MHIVSIVLQVILGVLFLMAAFSKFGSKQQVEAFKHYGFSQGFRVFTGVVEVIGAAGMIVGIWYPVIATLAGLWLGIIMVGATITHIRAKDPGKATAMPIILLILAVVVAVLNWKL
jgi:putative oxidoreductase